MVSYSPKSMLKNLVAKYSVIVSQYTDDFLHGTELIVTKSQNSIDFNMWLIFTYQFYVKLTSCVPVSAHQPALCYGVIRQSRQKKWIVRNLTDTYIFPNK